MRQRSTRYTIRAGRNLPDKEFRYLRTVIVTADIHGDLGSQLRRHCCRLTAHRNLSALVTCHTLYVVFTTWQSAVFLVNSRLTHFTATPSLLSGNAKTEFDIQNPAKLTPFPGGVASSRIPVSELLAFTPFWLCPKRRGHPFFRSYGARLPSSLTRFHSRALAQLCPPTCVGLRYGRPWERREAFLGSCFNGSALAEASTSAPLRADRHFQPAAHLYRNVTFQLNHSRCRNIKPAVHRLRPSASA